MSIAYRPISADPAIVRMVELGLTERQAEVFSYLVDSTLRDGFQPTVREAMQDLHINTPNGVICHFRALQRKGWLGPSDNQSRALPFLRTLDGSPFKGLTFIED